MDTAHLIKYNFIYSNRSNNFPNHNHIVNLFNILSVAQFVNRSMLKKCQRKKVVIN